MTPFSLCPPASSSFSRPPFSSPPKNPKILVSLVSPRRFQCLGANAFLGENNGATDKKRRENSDEEEHQTTKDSQPSPSTRLRWTSGHSCTVCRVCDDCYLPRHDSDHCCPHLYFLANALLVVELHCWFDVSGSFASLFPSFLSFAFLLFPSPPFLSFPFPFLIHNNTVPHCKRQHPPNPYSAR